MGRSPCCDKAAVKRGPWSPEEDDLLRSYIGKHGTGGNWITLPSKAGLKRCGKSCRLRWLNYLRPHIKHGGYTDEEDRLICALYNEIGSKWSVIASKLPGRTDNDVKNYWNTKLKKKQAVLAPPPSMETHSSGSSHTAHPLARVDTDDHHVNWQLAAPEGDDWDGLLFLEHGASVEAAASLEMPMSYFPNMTEIWASADHAPRGICGGLT